MNATQFSIVFSALALIISWTAYTRPRKPGGAVQWKTEIAEESHSIRITHTGTRIARRLSVNVLYTSIVNDSKTANKSFPGESFTIHFYRSMGSPNPVLEITWYEFRVLKRVRKIEI